MCYSYIRIEAISQADENATIGLPYQINYAHILHLEPGYGHLAELT